MQEEGHFGREKKFQAYSYRDCLKPGEEIVIDHTIRVDEGGIEALCALDEETLLSLRQTCLEEETEIYEALVAKAGEWEKFTRCNTLKGDYTEQAILERIEGKRTVISGQTANKNSITKVGLLIDIEAAIRAGKGPGYERWAKVFNLKQLSQTVLYLKENGDMSYEELQKKCADATGKFNDLSSKIKDLEAQINANGELQKQIANYAKTRAAYAEYKKSGYSKNYKAEHEGEILLHQAAKKHFDQLGITKLPSVKGLREEYAKLLDEKRKAYSSYKQARNDMRELLNVQANVNYLLDADKKSLEKETEIQKTK